MPPKARRAASAGASGRLGGRAACGVKYPPRQEQRSDALPESVGIGVRANFGRRYSLVVPPSGWRPLPGEPFPLSHELKREYVYGYNGNCKGSIHIISDEECVYPVASLVVVHNFARNTQKHFEGHSNDVTCVGWNERRKICASGQEDPKGAGTPYVAIWPPARPEQAISHLVHPSNARKVCAVAFSPDGETAVSFAADDGATFFIWRGFAKWDGNSNFGCLRDVKVEQYTPTFTCSSGRSLTDSIYMIDAKDPTMLFFYTVGDAHFKCWTVDLEGDGVQPTVSQKKGICGKCAQFKQPTGIACSVTRGQAVMSAKNGHLYTLQGQQAASDKRLVPDRTQTAMGCVAMLKDGRWLAGSTDGTLYVGTAEGEIRVEETIAFADLAGNDAKLFRSTTVPKFSDISVRGNWALLGTSNHCLVLLHLERRDARVMQVSHTDEAWAMDFHPSLAILATASKACDVRFWNVADKRPAVGKILKAKAEVISLAFRPQGDLLALGCERGILEVCGFPSLQPVFVETLSKGGPSRAERISCLRFSDKGNLLAAASFDMVIYLLKVVGASHGRPAQITMHKTLLGNSSSLLTVMFSADGEHLMSNSKDTQILFWHTKDGARQTSLSGYRDTKWQQPWTALHGWHVIGAWGDPDYAGLSLNSICQSMEPEPGYFALGDDMGKIKLFRFPSPFTDPPHQICGGHASHVTAVKFSRTNVLCALGGDDHSISQWKLAPVPTEEWGGEKKIQEVVHPWHHLEEPGEAPAPADRLMWLGRQGRDAPMRQHFADDDPAAARRAEAARAAAYGPPMAGYAPPARGLPGAPGARTRANSQPQGPAAGQMRPASAQGRAATPGGGGRHDSAGVAAAFQWD